MFDRVDGAVHLNVDDDDYRDICSFCAEIRRERDNNLLLELMPDIDPADFILWETDDFVVIPGVGAVCDGYVLISPKEHVLSFGHLDDDLDDQLTSLLSTVERWMTDHYGLAILGFEHGAESFRNRGGSCTDHAHMHVFPADPRLDLVTSVGSEFPLRPVGRLLPAVREQVQLRRRPYLWLRDTGGLMWLSDAPRALSQYLRRIIVGQLGRPDEWDWVVFPGVEYLRRTIQHVHEEKR